MTSTKRWAGFGFVIFAAAFVHGIGCAGSSGGMPVDGGTDGTTTTTSTSTGSGGSGGSTPGTTKIGASCKADSDCGSDLVCIKPTDNLSNITPGGVPNGFCTSECTTDASACRAKGAVCVSVDPSTTRTPKAYCFEACKKGQPLPTEAKCHDREDMVCEPVNPTETLFSCIPVCVTDDDCGGRKCEASSGLCVDTPMTGKPIGSGCTIVRGTPNTECEGGLCMQLDEFPDGGNTAPGICTALCRLGTTAACNYRITPVDAGPPMGGCLLPWRDNAGYDWGDLGLCVQLCESTGDCSYSAPDWTCRTDQRIRDLGGHAVCWFAIPG